jgi:hypothetical protein
VAVSGLGLSRATDRGRDGAVQARMSQKVAVSVVFVAAMFMSIMDSTA